MISVLNMPETKNPFELNGMPLAHQKEVRSISRDIESRSAQYTERGQDIPQKEILKEILNNQPGMSSPQAVSATDDGPSDAARIKLAKKSEKLNEVVKYAKVRGPIKASLLVKKIGDPWLEDQFHDLLIKFHDDLVRANKIKEER